MLGITDKVRTLWTAYRRSLKRPPHLEARPWEIRCLNHLDETIWAVPWASIRKIAAFKRDEISTDLICWEIEFDAGDGPGLVEIHEELVGFQDVVDEALRRKMADPKWVSLVMQPAFATCWTVIYDSSVSNPTSVDPAGAC